MEIKRLILSLFSIRNDLVVRHSNGIGGLFVFIGDAIQASTAGPESGTDTAIDMDSIPA